MTPLTQAERDVTTPERELLEKARKAILSVYKTIGTPGDYGYHTPKGEALKFLYDVHNEIQAALDRASARDGGQVDG